MPGCHYRNRIRRSKMNNQQAIDRLVKHLEWGWSEETVDAIEDKENSNENDNEESTM